MCGIIALSLADRRAHCAQEMFDGLTILQHRGQDSSGIVTSQSVDLRAKKFNRRVGMGVVRDVFLPHHMVKLQGNLGVGHVRYPTAGVNTNNEAQPMYSSFPCGIVLAHNGNLTNASELADSVLLRYRHLNTSSDTEIMLNVFSDQLSKIIEDEDPHLSLKNNPQIVFKAVERTMKLCRGAYSVVIMLHNFGTIAFRDPHGIRPLVMGKRKSKTLKDGVDFIFASESCVLDALGYDCERDVKGGECVIALCGDIMGSRHRLQQQLITLDDGISPCIFEYVYFARDDSIMNGVSIHSARKLMGVKIAEKIKRLRPNHDIDIVVPVPDTSRTSAQACARVLGLPYQEGLVKNRYIGRTFIMPGQEVRKKNVRLKLNPIPSIFKDKVVLLVDDSIVRGTTSKEINNMVRNAGAKAIYFASASPPILHPNVYGIDIPSYDELVAHRTKNSQVEDELKCEWVIYQDLNDLKDCISAINPSLKNFECSTFDGIYATETFDETILSDSPDFNFERYGGSRYSENN